MPREVLLVRVPTQKSPYQHQKQSDTVTWAIAEYPENYRYRSTLEWFLQLRLRNQDTWYESINSLLY